MSLVFLDSFDHYSTAQLARKWNNVSIYAQIDAKGRNGSNALVNIQTAACALGKSVPAAGTYIVGMAFKPDLSFSFGRLVEFETDDARQIQVCVTASGAIVAYVSNEAYPNLYASPVATSENFLLPDTWQYIECKVYLHASAGRIVVRVDGATWIDFTGNTIVDGHTTLNQVLFHVDWPYSTDHAVHIDDVYICDATGALNNDFLGDVQIKCVYPTGAGAHSDFARSASTYNYQCVDETPIDDADYVSSSTKDNIDTYACGDVATSGITIKGVQVVASAQKSDTGSRSIRLEARPGSTDYDDGADHALTTSWSCHRGIFETNGDTGLPWTPTEFNASQFGAKVSV